jgi:hypothetical protein
MLDQEALKKIIKSSGFGVVVMTALAYLGAFAFEFSLLRVYGIDYRIIEVNTSILILSGLFVLAGLIYVKAGYEIFQEKKQMVAEQLRGTWSVMMAQGLILYAAMSVAAWSLSLHEEFLYAKMAGVILVSALAACLIRVGMKLLKLTLPQQHNVPATKALFSKAADTYLGIALIMLCIGLCLGKVYARLQWSFPVVKKTGTVDRVIIQDFGDKLVLKDYDVKAKRFLGGYTIVYPETDIQVIDSLDTNKRR